MKRSSTARRLRSLANLIVALLSLLCLQSVASAEVREISLADLAKRSEWIVVARVTKVEAGPADLEELDPSMPRFKIATAAVIETWKGTPVREVRYIASPSWMCDTSYAELGEKVVLFLAKRRDSNYLEITHAGCGRMPLLTYSERPFAQLASEVMLPDGTATITQWKTFNFASIGGKLENPPDGTASVQFPIEWIEFHLLKRLVKSTAR